MSKKFVDDSFSGNFILAWLELSSYKRATALWEERLVAGVLRSGSALRSVGGGLAIRPP